MKKTLLHYGFISSLVLIGLITQTEAAEIQPLTSAVIINQNQGESSIDIKNTDSQPIILYSKVNHLDDDNLDGGVIYPSPAAVIVQPGEVQTVRIIYKNNHSINVEHLARIIFTGIPNQKESTGQRINFLVGQDLPIVIQPGNQPPIKALWSLVKWQQIDGKLCAKNPTTRVFRFDNNVKILPTGQYIKFTTPYLLPHQQQCIELNQALPAHAQIHFDSISVFNYRMLGHDVTVL
ncbi:fimbria/pilus periplasmic chaperone [Serratia sp. UGAL515B_01]|uniref:fimbria/pilus periplasmic chaperone n=1 Tax=Serratia sp. UGAL515B_01 TaxID=2986763 RepID=UPI002954933E|nr:fimbria/pilus periplasmic chaperone [Serratia sp. UGAL515B_01]WON77969.1 fimbria/pilus periplasmic chaperone [Serratia sp. UGAL515B_01]